MPLGRPNLHSCLRHLGRNKVLVRLHPASSAVHPGTWQYQCAEGTLGTGTWQYQCAKGKLQETSRHICRHNNVDCVNADRATHIDHQRESNHGTSALDRSPASRRSSSPAETDSAREMDSRPLELERRQHQKVATETLRSPGGQASPCVSDLRANFRPQLCSRSVGNQKLTDKNVIQALSQTSHEEHPVPEPSEDGR